jgi:hypothetical protein
MTYNLAKKLKDAGFPLNPKRDWDKSDWFWLPIDKMTKDDREKCYIPTLSELIKACGEKFDSLGLGKTEPKHWIVKSRNMDININIGGNKTPEEAVANLWLELNND